MSGVRKEPPAAEAATSRAWFAAVMLGLIGVCSFLDRQVLALLIDPVRKDLAISDTQISLLTGLSFAILYAIASLPLARLADQWSARGVIGVGVALWGTMTMACAGASSFAALFVARMGVGLGEAALSPGAYALLSRAFPDARRAAGFGVFLLSAPLGYGLAMLIGASLVDLGAVLARLDLPVLGGSPWRIVLLCAGLLTLATLIPWAFVRLERPVAADPARSSSSSALFAHLWRRRGAYAPLFIGAPIANVAVYAVLSWTPSWFIRVADYSAGDAGRLLGLMSITVGCLGTLAGAALTDRLSARRADGPILASLVGAVTLGGGSLLLVAGLGPLGGQLFFAFTCFGVGVMSVAPPVALQAITPPELRAQVSALYLTATGLVGIICGPTAVAMVADGAGAGRDAIGPAITVVTAGACTLAALVWGLMRRAYTDAVREGAAV